MVIIACLCAVTCTKQEKNPFFSEWKTEFEVPQFDQISKEHYLPAFRKGIEQQKGDIEKIVADQSEPTFENTIEALEESGALLRKVSSVFNVLNGSMTDDEMHFLMRRFSNASKQFMTRERSLI